MRADLLALTPEKLAALANAGLVKRAQRELERGQGPRVEEDAAGVVTGTFADGVVAALPPGVALGDAPCSCGAVGACRHRVAVALAYAALRAAAPAEAERWSPACFDDAALEAALGRRVVARARRLGDLVVTVVPGATPEAALPTCTVRFLVPRDLAYARCDCAAGGGCEHVAAAALAFRAAGPLDAPRTLTLGGEAEVAAASADPLTDALALAGEVLVEGVVEARPGLEQRFARVRRALEGAGLLWPAMALDELSAQLAAYRQRSARHRAARVAAVLAELAARARAAGRPGELPRAVILGQGEAPETLLDRVRLVSLGARVDVVEGDTAEVSVFLADADAGTVLVLEKQYPGAPAGAALAGRSAAPGVSLGLLAHGQLVSKAVRRRANRTIALGGGVGRSAVSGQTGDWGLLPATLVVTDAAGRGRAIADRPPRLLAPRVLAEDVVVVAVEAVLDARYAPGEQALTATLEAAGGGEVRLERRHRAAAPHALDALARALSGHEGPLRFVSGALRRGAEGLVLDPLAVAADRLVVLDLAPAPASPAPPLPPPAAGASPHQALVGAAAGALEGLAHRGLAGATPTDRAGLDALAARLEAAGLLEMARRLRALGAALAGVQADPGPAAAAWFDAAIRLDLLAEAV